jgi:deazaflavin-dependent oxidoreductase (nitroreductase family)
MSRLEPFSVGSPIPTERAQTLRLQGLVNAVMRGLLCAPLLSLAVGKRLTTVYAVGRRTGRHYAVPVAYTRHGGRLLVASQFAWVRNLRSGEPVDIRLRGRRRAADVQVLRDEAGVVEHLGVMARDNHQFAKFNKIGFDEHGAPSPDDLHLAWAAGTRVALLTPQ